jgi:ABC-type sugar transport system substrate-binding protein
MRSFGWRVVFGLTLFLFTVVAAGVVGAEAQKKYSVYLFEVGFDNPYFLGHIHGAQDAAAKYPDLDLVIIDGRNDPATQATQVVQTIAKGVDGILLNPITSDALVPAAREAKAAGIPVFCTDRDIADPSFRIAAVGSDQRLIGRIAAKYAIDFLEQSGRPKPWKIVILEGLAGALANTERTGGWYEILQPFIDKKEIAIVADVPADWAREPAVRKMNEILAKTKEIDLILASNDEIAAGAIVALEAAGLVPNKDVFIVGVDASPVGLQLIKDGKLLATVAHQAYLQGYWAVEMIMKYLKEGVTPPEGKWPNNYIITENFMVDKTNVESVGPFGEPAKAGPVPELPY